jgi:hypothetical protein
VLGGAEGIGWGFRRATAPCGSTNVGCVRRARAYVLEDARGFVVMARHRAEVGIGELVLEVRLRSGGTEWERVAWLVPRNRPWHVLFISTYIHHGKPLKEHLTDTQATMMSSILYAAPRYRSPSASPSSS